MNMSDDNTYVYFFPKGKPVSSGGGVTTVGRS